MQIEDGPLWGEWGGWLFVLIVWGAFVLGFYSNNP
jgi:hypothetical protein